MCTLNYMNIWHRHLATLSWNSQSQSQCQITFRCCIIHCTLWTWNARSPRSFTWLICVENYTPLILIIFLDKTNHTFQMLKMFVNRTFITWNIWIQDKIVRHLDYHLNPQTLQLLDYPTIQILTVKVGSWNLNWVVTKGNLHYL